MNKSEVITINIYYTGKNGSAREYVNEMICSGIVDAIRAKDGNERYDYFYPMDDSETVLLIDRWKDQAALDEHHHSDLMPKIAALREKYDLHMKVERYISVESEADKEYIRN